jgi:protein-tyrosine phosphatase
LVNKITMFAKKIFLPKYQKLLAGTENSIVKLGFHSFADVCINNIRYPCNMQSLITKFFKTPTNSKQPYYEFLFEKEEAERKKREEEEERRRIEEEERIAKEEAEAAERRRIKRELLQAKREEERKLKEEAAKKKTEGRVIFPGLYLGSRLAAQNRDWLCQNYIKYVLNVTSETRNYYEKDEELQLVYYNINVMDGIDEDLYSHFNAAADFIHNALEQYNTTFHPNFIAKMSNGNHENDTKMDNDGQQDDANEEEESDVTYTNKRGGPAILIHCREGLSRSPTIVIAYLLLKGKQLFAQENSKLDDSCNEVTLEKAYNHVLEKSFGVLNINAGFLRQLMKLEMELLNKNTIDFFDKMNRRINSDLSYIPSKSENIEDKAVKNGLPMKENEKNEEIAVKNTLDNVESTDDSSQAKKRKREAESCDQNDKESLDSNDESRIVNSKEECKRQKSESDEEEAAKTL